MSEWRVGTAGWSIAARYADALASSGSQLDRYSQRLNATEINSCFNRSHRRQTYERWADSVPDGFRFSVKLPRSMTHERRLVDCQALLEQFLEEVGGLGAKLAVLLVQIPPSLAFDAGVAGTFFRTMREITGLGIALEPRHASWFDGEAATLLQEFRIARVVADPARHAGAERQAGWAGLAYFRLHGSPRVYFSDYEAEALADIERRLRESADAGAEVWCIFDNTAASHALGNALAIAAME